MNDEKLLILDESIRNSLIVFLVFFAGFLSYTYVRLHERKKKLAEHFEALYLSSLEAEQLQEPVPEREHFVPTTNPLQPVFRSLVVSLLVGALSFLFFAFTPLPFLHNFATVGTWHTQPLRLTLLEYERFYEGFSLDGEVWNQAEESIDGLQVIVRIWGTKDDLLDELTLPVLPSSLLPGRAGRFDLRYTEHSPFLAGYEVTFTDAEGNEIPHLEGFDVR
jgi:hypothetical protein